MKARHFLLTAGLVLVLGCGGNGGNGQEDIIPDPQPEQEVTPDLQDEDVPVEVPEEETITEPLKACVLPCSTETECCISASCGTYPDKWTCSGACELGGCADDPECIDWATRRSLPNAGTYACRAYAGAAARCVAACSSEAECCPSGDCTSYPNRHVCDGGYCFLGGCTGDEECKTWAAGRSLHMADSYVCRQPLGGGISVCAQGCTTPDDCCPPEAAPCTTLPSHFSCTDGICMLTCSSDEECKAFAASSSYPQAERYVCQEM